MRRTPRFRIGDASVAAIPAAFAALLLVAVPLPAEAFFGGSAPGEKEPFVRSLEPGRWTPSIVDGELVDRQVRAQRQEGNRFLSDDPTGVGAPTQTAPTHTTPAPTASGAGNVVVGERLSPYSDGLTMARMTTYGLVPAPRIEAYLEEIAERLLAVSPIQGAPFDIRLVGSQNLGDAAAMPDGVVTVPVGLLSAAVSEDEIAGLLAHELTHVLLNHHDSDWLDRTNQQLVSAAEIGAGLMMELGQSLGVLQQGAAQKEMLIGYAASQGTLFLTGTLLTPDWSREQELEADMLAVDLAFAAGYNPEGYLELLNRVADQEKMMPTREERVAQLRADVDARASQRMAEGLQSGSGIDVAFGLFEKGAFELNEAFAPLRDTHPSTEERIALLETYFERHYLDNPDLQLTLLQGPLIALRSDPEVQQILANYEAAWRAGTMTDDSREAEALARQAVSGPTDKHALPRLAFATVRGAQGDTRRERLNLALALEGPEPNLAVYQRAIVTDLTSGDDGTAFALLTEAWDRFKRPAALYPFMIHASVVQGDRQRGTALNNECRLYFRTSARLCSEALNGNLQALLDPEPAGYVPPPSATGLPAGDGAGAGASGQSGFGAPAAAFDGSQPSSGGVGDTVGGFLEGLLQNLPTEAPEDDGSNQFDGGAGAGNSR